MRWCSDCWFFQTGLTGHFIQPFLGVADFHSLSMMSWWASYHMVASVSQLVQGQFFLEAHYRCYRCFDIKVFHFTVRWWNDAKNDQTCPKGQKYAGVLQRRRRSLTRSTEAKGGEAYHTAGTSEYTVHMVINYGLLGYSARLLSFFGKPFDSPRLSAFVNPGWYEHVQHIGGSYISMDKSMHGLSGIKLSMTNQNVKDQYLSPCCRHCFSSHQKFIFERWRNCGLMK